MTLKVRMTIPICCPWSSPNPAIPYQALIERVAMYEHAYTCYGSVRPFGISTIVAGVDKTGPQLFVVEPSGSYYGYRASAVGKGRQLAKTELEKLDLADITVKQGVMEVARM
jgi:20S proteasome subunit alpha 7